MKLNQIFLKPVDRPIEGVIKADDEAGLNIEIEEYVLTNEIEKRLAAFLSAYNNYQVANGVWISGFFGSGKSHLLKMLAYLLDNQTIDTAPIVDSFVTKTDDRVLRAELMKAASIPAKSILFNIDQKADVISKKDLDALLGVFLKVFNEMQGYYGKQAYIAQFERELDDRGIYNTFKDEFARISGISWEEGREQSILEGDNIANAYASVTGTSPTSALGILDKYRSSYQVSIEDFAELVNNYIQRQGSMFRLNFFVDEVGQYIADSVKLMTNLQTIAESLATKCRGRAWIVVTAQEDMNTVVGEMGLQQGNDFSKIQARFSTRMKLTSQDVAEVIQKRLLAKNDQGNAEIATIYDHQANNFKTLFDFADGAQSYKNFKDKEHFVDAYPFIPYQFVLFQSAIQSLSQHNAFEGKHSSVGERSMLGVFQQVAVHIGNYDVGQLATFDLMFEGIRNSLKANIQRSILNAEQNLDNPFALRLLKALFLVKYVKEFKATERNLSVLMTDRFGQDISKLRKDVQEALDILEQQTYIQRNGELYEFLTDEEKDVEQDIKSTEIDLSSVSDELGSIVFDRIIRDTKIRTEEGTTDYSFTRIVDSRPFKGKISELGIHLITPLNEHAATLSILMAQSMGRDELVIVLPSDNRVISDLTLYLQTQKYFNQNISMAQNDRIKVILNNKQFQNNERRLDIERQARDHVVKATFIINGSELDVNSTDAQTKVIKGFYQLIRTTYTNLKMLPNIVYKDSDISKYLYASDDLFGGDGVELSESEREILNYIVLQKNNGVRITLKTLTERFERKPYGWYLAAILCTLAKLYARGRIEIRQDSNALEAPELEQALVNTRIHPNLILAPEEQFTPAQVRALKDFYNEFFDKPPAFDEAKELATETKEGLQAQFEKLNTLASQSRAYPFLQALSPVLDRLRAVMGKPYAWYISDFKDDADALLDLKDDVISPILSFMNGGQRKIYDDARDFLKNQQANFESIGSVGFDEALQIKQTLEDPNCFRGESMRKVKNLKDNLQTQIDATLKQVKSEATASLVTLHNRVQADERFGQLSTFQQENILESFRDIDNHLNDYTVIAVVKEEVRRFQDETFTKLLTQIDQWLHENAKAAGGTQPPPPVAKYIRSSDISVAFTKLSLDDENDVDAYLKMLREAYLQQIRDGKRIQL